MAKLKYKTYDDMRNDDEKGVSLMKLNCHTAETEDLVEKVPIFYADQSIMEREIPDLVICYKESTHEFVKDICIDHAAVKANLPYSNLDEKVCKFHNERYEAVREIDKEKDDCSKDLHLVPETSTDKYHEFSDNKFSDNKSNLIMHHSCQIPTNEDHLRNHPMATQLGQPNICCPAVTAASDKPDRSIEEVSLAAHSSSLANEVSEDINVDSSRIAFGLDSPTPTEKFRFEALETGKTTNDQELLRSSEVGLVDSGCTASESLSRLTSGNLSRLEDSGGQFSFQLENGESSFSAFAHQLGSSTRIEDGHGQSISDHLQYFNGETSFSSGGLESGLMSYLGPVADSGSLSLRSESSATSTRSFAFPVLQSEWNSSPVRMAKADQRQLRKHSWRHNLLCCRF